MRRKQSVKNSNHDVTYAEEWGQVNILSSSSFAPNCSSVTSELLYVMPICTPL